MSKSSDVVKVVESILGSSDRIEVDLNDPALDGIKSQITKARVRMDLSLKGISVEVPKKGTTITFNRIGALGGEPAASAPKKDESKPAEKSAPSKPKAKPEPKKYQHSYIVPKMAKDILDALLDDASHVLWFSGPTGTGKNVLTYYLGRELGREVVKVNCRKMTSEEALFGENTIEIDEATGQNHIVFRDGPIVKAMQVGLDDDGNEVGPPAILFLDEAGALSSSIMLNALLESDNPRREITLDMDGGRVVRSHSKFRIVLAANTAGRGATSMADTMYTDQMDALDISTLNRVAMSFKFGYNRTVEKRIAMEKLGDDRVVKQIMDLRDSVRENIRGGKLSSPFSTRNIVQICNSYRIYGDLPKAIYYVMFGKILPEEQAVYNEIIVAKLGKDILKDMVEDDVDYM